MKSKTSQSHNGISCFSQHYHHQFQKLSLLSSVVDALSSSLSEESSVVGDEAEGDAPKGVSVVGSMIGGAEKGKRIDWCYENRNT